eukprot:654334-Prymnesium_polylepis.1
MSYAASSTSGRPHVWPPLGSEGSGGSDARGHARGRAWTTGSDCGTGALATRSSRESPKPGALGWHADSTPQLPHS